MSNLERRSGQQPPSMIKREPMKLTCKNELIITDRRIFDHVKKLARTMDSDNAGPIFPGRYM